MPAPFIDIRSFALLLLTTFAVHLNAANILVFGDSLSAGYGLEHGQAWPYLLQKDLKHDNKVKGYTVVNQSISGETTTGGLLRIDKALDQYKPAIVILELGANDGLRGSSLKNMRKNLTSMIEKSKAAGAEVLLVGMYIPPNYGTRYSQAFHQSFQDIAAAQDIPLMPFLLDEVALDSKLMQADGLHPTKDAQPIIADNLMKYLQPLLQQKQ